MQSRAANLPSLFSVTIYYTIITFQKCTVIIICYYLIHFSEKVWKFMRPNSLFFHAEKNDYSIPFLFGEMTKKSMNKMTKIYMIQKNYFFI